MAGLISLAVLALAVGSIFFYRRKKQPQQDQTNTADVVEPAQSVSADLDLKKNVGTATTSRNGWPKISEPIEVIYRLPEPRSEMDEYYSVRKWAPDLSPRALLAGKHFNVEDDGLGKLGALKADRYVITIRTATYVSKLFQIQFGKDGSMYVAMPYLENARGRVGEVKILANTNTAELGANAPLTSHGVKYAHHPGGEAHFSLTGKVRTDIRKQSVKLHEVNGHLFSISFHGMSRFEPQPPDEISTSKRAIVEFEVTDDEPESIVFMAHYYSRSVLAKRFLILLGNPWLAVGAQDAVYPGVVLATPYWHNGEDHFLQLTLLHSSDRKLPQVDAGTLFMGGFDIAAHQQDRTRDRSLLMCIYPETGNLQEILDACGTIDLAPNWIPQTGDEDLPAGFSYQFLFKDGNGQ